ncbi:MAG: hypothetical protein O2923_13855 [Verrucomicrobia bacterium]|nr:hypothetical protein [Verrucomicrobiota bacterium]MDA1088018.1 hypothetical protein [Verrucomicrobiota bacterium]
MIKILIWLGHLVAIGLIIAGVATDAVTFIVLGVVFEILLWAYTIFIFPDSGSPIREPRPKHTREGMINLQGFKRDRKEED